MQPHSKIYVAGHTGMLGSALVRLLKEKGFSNLLLASSQDFDLRNQHAVDKFFHEQQPEYVFHCAAKVGGILANHNYPAEFLHDNLMIGSNVIHAAFKAGVKKLIFAGSSCIYPKHSAQPIKEEYLLSGALEPTNEPYALAKIAAIKLCQYYNKQYGTSFHSLMPCNLYGSNDHYDLQRSHVLPALLRKFHEAKERNEDTVTIWGTGKPLREFLHVDDAAAAMFFVMEQNIDWDWVNAGSGAEITIATLAEKIKQTVGYSGQIIFDEHYPDGTPRKLLDSSKLKNLGWKPTMTLEEGIAKTYEDFVRNYSQYAE